MTWRTGWLAWILCLSLGLLDCARSADLEPAFDLALAADMLTTLDIRHHSGMYETNPVLGRHPSDAKVLAYFSACAGIHYVITDQMFKHNMPMPIINAWQVLTIGVETGYATRNYSIGLRMRF